MPKELKEFAARDYKRINRRAADPEDRLRWTAEAIFYEAKSIEDIRAALEAVRAEEREACAALIFDNVPATPETLMYREAIRARGLKE